MGITANLSEWWGYPSLYSAHQRSIMDGEWSVIDDVIYPMTIASYLAGWNRWNGRAIYSEIAVLYFILTPLFVIRINLQYVRSPRASCRANNN